MSVLHPTAWFLQMGHSFVTVSVLCMEGWGEGHFRQRAYTLISNGLRDITVNAWNSASFATVARGC